MCPLGLHHQQQQNLRRFAGTAAPATSFLWLSASLLRVYRQWSDFCFKGGKFVLSSAATPENVRYGPIFGLLLQRCGSRPPKPKVANSSKQSLGSGLCMVLVGSNIHTCIHTYSTYIHNTYAIHTHTCHLPYPTYITIHDITLHDMNTLTYRTLHHSTIQTLQTDGRTYRRMCYLCMYTYIYIFACVHTLFVLLLTSVLELVFTLTCFYLHLRLCLCRCEGDASTSFA